MFLIQDTNASGATGKTSTAATGLKKKKKSIVVKDSTVATVKDTSAKDSIVVNFTDTVLFPTSDLTISRTDTHPERFLVLRKDTAVMPVTELFGEHVLVPSHPAPTKKPTLSPDWLFPLILLMLGMLTWLRIFYIRSFRRMFTALFNINLANQIVRDENLLLQKATVYLNLLFCLSGALFLYTISTQKGWGSEYISTGLNRYLIFVGLILAVYLLKYIVLKFCGWLFNLERELSTYLFTVYLTNNLAGLVIFPISIIMLFNSDIDGKILTDLGLIVIGVAYTMRILRGVTIGWTVPQVRPLYIIFYLCTLEIAPLSILLRLIARI